MSKLADVTVVIVNYNSAHVIESCLAKLEDAAATIIVDNASTDDSLARAEAVCPHVTIIRNLENLGYGCAVNQGFSQVETPYALIINPDAELDAEAVSKLVEGMTQYSNAAITAPYLFSPARGLELAGMGPHDNNQGPFSVVPEGPFSTWFITGAVWLCRMSAWRDVGGFDENIFLYGEDRDLCRRATDKGYTLIYIPASEGIHLVSQATKPTRRIRWRKEWNIVWSHLYLTKKYDGQDVARSEGYRLLRRHGPKALFYALVIQPKRFFRDLAVAHAAYTYLRGGKPARGI